MRVLLAAVLCLVASVASAQSTVRISWDAPVGGPAAPPAPCRTPRGRVLPLFSPSPPLPRSQAPSYGPGTALFPSAVPTEPPRGPLPRLAAASAGAGSTALPGAFAPPARGRLPWLPDADRVAGAVSPRACDRPRAPSVAPPRSLSRPRRRHDRGCPPPARSQATSYEPEPAPGSGAAPAGPLRGPLPAPTVAGPGEGLTALPGVLVPPGPPLPEVG